jgi:hypothetical protein
MAILMSQRERYIAMGAGGAVVLLLLNYFVLEPYMDERNAIATRTTNLYKQLSDANDLFARERKLKPVWDQMQRGLSVDSSTAESQAEQAVLDWADTSGVSLTGIRPGKTSQEGKFTMVSFVVTGTCAMPDLARMLWSLESARIPLRISEVQLKPRKEGTDDLLATFTLSALCMPPDEQLTNHAARSAAPMNEGGLQ